jgi:hypothetical protein
MCCAGQVCWFILNIFEEHDSSMLMQCKIAQRRGKILIMRSLSVIVSR